RCANRMTEFAKHPEFGDTRSGLDADAIVGLTDGQTFDICLISADGLSNQEFRNTVSAARDHNPQITIILTEAPESPQKIINFIEGGAWSYIHRWASNEELVNQVRKAARGTSQFSPAVAGALVNRVQELSAHHANGLSLSNGYTELTPREHEVLSLIGQRMTNRQIAEELVLEVGTVKNHVHNLLKKLEVDNRYEAASYSLSSPVSLAQRTP
ncbi:MAG: response regulator transcription factor, partial [Anaerolineales bacterium]